MNSPPKTINLRGHHLICLHFFKGKGYNADFIKYLGKIIKRAEAGEEITICSGADEVCNICPYLKKNKCLLKKDSEKEIREMDRIALKLLGLRNKDKILWLNIRKCIPVIISRWSKKFCKGCSWREACEEEPLYREFLDETVKGKI